MISSAGLRHLILTTLSAASWAALGICYNTGQDCTAGSRLYIQASVYDEFIDILVAKVKATAIGDGFDEQSTGGPVVCLPKIWCEGPFNSLGLGFQRPI
jgi:acyl-CoA reductase-like NAD-dependent aldehyde dehydrogenase